MLDVIDASARYDTDMPALRGVSFSLRAGERVALVGANGAGKSTLLLALCGVLPLSGGEVRLQGDVMTRRNLPQMRERMGMVFQNPDDQLFMPTVAEDIAFGPRNAGAAQAEIDARMADVLRRLGIEGLRDRLSHRLSGGEKRLVALAGVLVMDPVLLLMDEPTSFLDPRARRRLIDTLRDLPQAMLIATHDLDMALELCPRALVLRGGELRADAAAGDVLWDAALMDECGLELPLGRG